MYYYARFISNDILHVIHTHTDTFNIYILKFSPTSYFPLPTFYYIFSLNRLSLSLSSFFPGAFSCAHFFPEFNMELHGTWTNSFKVLIRLRQVKAIFIIKKNLSSSFRVHTGLKTSLIPATSFRITYENGNIPDFKSFR